MTLEHIHVYSSSSLYWNLISDFKNKVTLNVLIRNPVSLDADSFWKSLIWRRCSFSCQCFCVCSVLNVTYLTVSVIKVFFINEVHLDLVWFFFYEFMNFICSNSTYQIIWYVGMLSFVFKFTVWKLGLPFRGQVSGQVWVEISITI